MQDPKDSLPRICQIRWFCGTNKTTVRFKFSEFQRKRQARSSTLRLRISLRADDARFARLCVSKLL